MNEFHTLRELIDRLAERGDRPALIQLREDVVDRWSYADLARDVRLLADGLLGGGLEKGEIVAVLAGTRYESIVAALAVIDAGGVVSPVDVQFADETLVHIFNDSRAKRVFTTASEIERIAALEVDQDLDIVSIDSDESDEHDWRRWTADDPDAHRPPVEPKDEAALFYTSGTTGPPKGVPLSHHNVAFQIGSVMETGVVGESDRVLLPLPPHHVYPFVIGIFSPLALGGSLVIPHSLTGPQIVRAMREGEATVVVGVPRLYGALMTGIEGRIASGPVVVRSALRGMVRLAAWLQRRFGWRAGRFLLRPIRRQIGPDLRLLASGGSPLDPDLAARLEGMGWEVAIGYGLTETSPLLTLNLPGESKSGSVGRVIPGVDLRIDASALPEEKRTGQTEAANPEVGEVQARGGSVFGGYRNLPDKTRAAFTDDGWFRTGDLGHLDDDRYLFLRGRVSTLIVTEGGENVQPENVESAYEKAPEIREIGVLERNHRIVAVVVPELSDLHGQGPEAATRKIRETIQRISREMPSYQRVSDFVLTQESLPRTRLGKIRRHLLDRMYDRIKEGGEKAGDGAEPIPIGEMSDDDQALLENDAARSVWLWLADKYSDVRLTPDTSPQLDLGVDSIEWLNLTLEIRQRTGVELTEEAIGDVETVRDLLAAVAEASKGTATESIEALLEHPEDALDEEDKRWLRPLNPLGRAEARLLHAVNRAAMKLVFRLEVEGRDRLPESGPYVIAPNHNSYVDSFVLAAALDYDRIARTFWAGWTGAAFRNPLTRLVSRLAKVVPIDPDRGILSSLAFGAVLLRRERNLIWYPEGRRSDDGQLQPFRPGIGLLLDRYSVPVVPVAILGSFEVLPRGRRIPRPRKIRLRFGKPLDPERLKEEGEGDTPQERIADGLRRQVVALIEKTTFPPK